ncbi:MAG: transferrin-binding protein-like solute binding protein [Cardiobacteriaceae bacterium]|nr:transferrin-binding protein-like solute binding protein [Cardiobacteriaceae bacterium]
MTKLTLALLGTSALMLAACGGSGGNNNAPTPPPTQLPPGNNAQQNPPPASSGIVQGVAYVLPAGSTIPSSASQLHETKSNYLSVLNAGGKQVTLQIPGIYSRGMTYLPGGANVDGKGYRTFVVSGSKYAYSKFGHVNDGETRIFSHGVLTTQMPAMGRVEYEGDSTIAQGSMVAIGDSDFVADFGQKTLVGYLTQEDRSPVIFNPIYINATITGNSFATAPGSTTARGYFYGPNAAELGGVFSDSSQQISGSFGARIDR